MNLTKYVVSAAALSVMLGTAAYAQTDEPATAIGCLHLQKKVSAALDANQQSPNYSTAKTRARDAASFCAHGVYKIGVDGYSKALDLLGAS
ncbi:MAG: hypothetical protein WDM86_11485 [Rhizomicrobium sp.]